MTHTSQPASFIHEDDPSTTTYCIDVISKLSGVSTQTIIHYQELGILTPSQHSDEFNSEHLRQLTRLEHLRSTHSLTDSAVVLVANLLTEIEHLRDERRQHLR